MKIPLILRIVLLTFLTVNSAIDVISSEIVADSDLASDNSLNGSVLNTENNRSDYAPITIFPTIVTGAGSTLQAPVLVYDFSNIGAISLTMAFDSDVMTFQGYSINSSLPFLAINQPIPGRLIASAFYTTGISLPDGATLFHLNFQFIEGYSLLEWIDNGASCEYAGPPPFYTALIDEPQEDFYIDGVIWEQGLIILNCPGNIIADNEPDLCGAELTFAATAYGIPEPEITYEMDGTPITSPHFFPVGTFTVIATASNEDGEESCSFTVTVNDIEEAAVDDDTSSFVDCLSQAVLPSAPSAWDNCDQEVAGVLHEVIDVPNPIICEGTRSYIFIYTDEAGNSNYWTHTYTIVPLNGPELIDEEYDCASLNQTGLEIGLQQAIEFDAKTLEPFVAALYHDNCGAEVSAELFDTFPGPDNADESWYFNYEFTITDLCDNMTTCIVTYSGGIAPTVPEDLEIEDLIVEDKEYFCFSDLNNIHIWNSTVFSGGKLELIALGSVIITPEFIVEQGGHFHAYISSEICSDPELLSEKNPVDPLFSIFHEPISIDNFTFTIYPNPGTGLFTIYLNDHLADGYISVYNTMGGIVISPFNSQKTKTEIDLTHQPDGVYVVVVKRDQELITKKLVKMK